MWRSGGTESFRDPWPWATELDSSMLTTNNKLYPKPHPFNSLNYSTVYCKCVFRNLQALVKGITLRRTKNSKVAGRMLVQLPERRVFVQHVTLSEEEKEEYEQVRKEGRKIIGRWAHFCLLWRASVSHKGQKTGTMYLQVFRRGNHNDKLRWCAGHPGPSEAVLLSPQSLGQIHRGRYKLEIKQLLIKLI